jgi:hypothetical protein
VASSADKSTIEQIDKIRLYFLELMGHKIVSSDSTIQHDFHIIVAGFPIRNSLALLVYNRGKSRLPGFIVPVLE